MGRKKRRSSQFKDSSTVIDMEEARKERQEKREQAETKKNPPQPDPVDSARQDRRKLALRRRRRRRTLLVFGVFAILLVMVGFSVGNIIVLKHDLHVAKKQQVVYQEEKEQLEKDLVQINDLDNLEEQARDQMRLIRPGETLYIFPDTMTQQ